MARDQLLGLTNDVDRLLAAGAAAAASNEHLRKRGKTLRDLSTQVAALKPVADAVDRVLDASARQAGNNFLDLIVMSRQLRANLSAVGEAGDLRAVPASGPWQTDRSVRDVYPLHEVLSSSRSGRQEKLREGLEDKVTSDMRLVPVLVGALDDGYAPVADLIAEQALPALGKAILPDLLGQLDIKGKTAQTRRLQLICKLDPAQGAQLCRQAVKEGSTAVRIKALELLPEVGDKGEAERIGLELLKDKKSKEVRGAALLALRAGSSDEALEAVLAAVRDKDFTVLNAGSVALAEMRHPRATTRLLRDIQETVARLDESKVPKQTKEAPGRKGSKKAAAQADARAALQKIKDKRSELALQTHFLLGILSRRTDCQKPEIAAVVVPWTAHEEEFVRKGAFSVLGATGPVIPEVLPALRKPLEAAKKSGMSLLAIQALRRFTPEQQKPAFDLILGLARNPKIDGRVRREAVSMLPGHWKEHHEAILSLLRSILVEKDHELRNTAKEALAEIGPEAQAAVPDLLRSVQKKQTGNPYASSPNPLPRLDPDGTQAIPVLIGMLKPPWSKKGPIIWQALLHLRDYGTKASVAIPDVAALLKHHQVYMQNCARLTLHALEGK